MAPMLAILLCLAPAVQGSRLSLWKRTPGSEQLTAWMELSRGGEGATIGGDLGIGRADFNLAIKRFSPNFDIYAVWTTDEATNSGTPDGPQTVCGRLSVDRLLQCYYANQHDPGLYKDENAIPYLSSKHKPKKPYIVVPPGRGTFWLDDLQSPTKARRLAYVGEEVNSGNGGPPAVQWGYRGLFGVEGAEKRHHTLATGFERFWFFNNPVTILSDAVPEFPQSLILDRSMILGLSFGTKKALPAQHFIRHNEGYYFYLYNEVKWNERGVDKYTYIATPVKVVSFWPKRLYDVVQCTLKRTLSCGLTEGVSQQNLGEKSKLKQPSLANRAIRSYLQKPKSKSYLKNAFAGQVIFVPFPSTMKLDLEKGLNAVPKLSFTPQT